MQIPFRQTVQFLQTIMNPTVALLCIAFGIYKTDAQCCALDGDSRVVKGMLDEPFSTETMLPGTYDSLVSGIDTIKIVNGDCSTPFFDCHIKQYLPYKSVARINGTMSFGLKTITFFSSENTAPINVVFLTNYYWNDMASNYIQPQYSLPLIVHAKNRKTVTLTCSIFMQTNNFELRSGWDQVPYFWATFFGTTNKVKEHPQILNLEDRSIALHRTVTLTVMQKFPLDIYTCKIGEQYLTHMIDWNTELDKSSYSIFDEAVSTFIGSNAGVKQDLSALMERIIMSILGDSASMSAVPVLLIGFSITIQHLF